MVARHSSSVHSTRMIWDKNWGNWNKQSLPSLQSLHQALIFVRPTKMEATLYKHPQVLIILVHQKEIQQDCKDLKRALQMAKPEKWSFKQGKEENIV